MGLREFFLWQLEQEAATSRTMIERVPEGWNTWKPHAGATELGQLAALVAAMPGWIALMVNRRVVDLSAPFNEARTESTPVPSLSTRVEWRQMLASGLEKSRKALEATTEDNLLCMVRFRRDGHVISEGPRYAMITDAAFTQQAQLRGRLGVYLGMLEAKALANSVESQPEYCYTVKESVFTNRNLFVESLKLKRNLRFISGSQSSEGGSALCIPQGPP